jgi:hypothetical protein
MHKNRQHADPLKTKTGKTRLGPLSIDKLQEMLKTAKPKHRSKIQSRIFLLNSKGIVSKNTEQDQSAAE